MGWTWTTQVLRPSQCKMVAVAYVLRLSRNLLFTRKPVEQWGKPLVNYKTKAVLGFPGEKSLVFSAPARDCFPEQV